MDKELLQKAYFNIERNIDFFKKLAQSLLKAGISMDDPEYYKKKLEETKEQIKPYLAMLELIEKEIKKECLK